MSETVALSVRAAYALELSRRREGYLSIACEMIDALREAGLITTRPACDGYLIAKAVPIPMKRSTPALRWHWYRRAVEQRAAP